MGLLAVALSLMSGCISQGPSDLSIIAATPAASVPAGTWHHIADGAVSFTLTWEGNATVEAEVIYPPDTAPYAAGHLLMRYDEEGAGWEALAANGGQGAVIHAGSIRGVAARPFNEPFPSLTQHASIELASPDGPKTQSFVLLAASGSASVPFEMWVNGSSFSVIDGPHDGAARALSFEDWRGGHAAKARAGSYGGTVVMDSSIEWETPNGTVAFYYRSHESLDSVIYERSRLSNANESWESEFASALLDTLEYDPQKTVPHGHFIVVSRETSWRYEVSRRVHLDFPVELFLVGDVKPPGGLVPSGESLLLPRFD